MTTDAPPPAAAPPELSAVERRVLGVLIEKGLTTPDQYPLTMNALENGCNQKSNREPVTSYDGVQLDGALQLLFRKGLAANATGTGGRVERFSSQMGKAFELRSVDVAVVGELLLRGPQSEGELRARASRMRPIQDLTALEEILTKLSSSAPPLVVRLTPPGRTRGVRYAHNFYPPHELAKLRASEAQARDAEPEASPAAEPDAEAAPPPAALHEVLTRLARLEARVQELESRLSR
jgi:uncharacterized protein YceH (UPF0502 family)